MASIAESEHYAQTLLERHNALYHGDPLERAAAKGAEVIENAAASVADTFASAYEFGRNHVKEASLAGLAVVTVLGSISEIDVSPAAAAPAPTAVAKSTPKGFRSETVESGDTLSGDHGLDSHVPGMTELEAQGATTKASGITDQNKIYVGETVYIPLGNPLPPPAVAAPAPANTANMAPVLAPAPAPTPVAPTSHPGRFLPGQNVTVVGERDGFTAAQFAAKNPGVNINLVYPNRDYNFPNPPGITSSSPVAAPAPANTALGSVTIKSGDTYWGLASLVGGNTANIARTLQADTGVSAGELIPGHNVTGPVADIQAIKTAEAKTSATPIAARATPAAAPAPATPNIAPAPSPKSNTETDTENSVLTKFLANYLVTNYDATQVGADGILANFKYESGMQPERLEGTPYGVATPIQSLSSEQLNDRNLGIGLAQFSPPNKLLEYAKQTGRDPNDPVVQTDFVVMQLKNDGLWDTIMAAKTPAEAAYLVAKYYEIPNYSDLIASLPDREHYADLFYSQFTPPASPPTSPTPAPTTTTTTEPAPTTTTTETSPTTTTVPAPASPNTLNPVDHTKDPFEYILTVPEGGVGHAVYYTNQVTDSKLIDPSVSGEADCGPASLAVVLASLKNNQYIDTQSLFNGLLSSGVYSNEQGITSISSFINYINKNLVPVQTIEPGGDRKALTTTDLDAAKIALAEGKIILAGTAVSVDSAGTMPTDGHWIVIYAMDGSNNLYAANVGDHVDSPEGGKPISPQTAMAWLNQGFYALG